MKNNSIKRDIRDLEIGELKKFLLENKEKAFRAKQIFEWLWKKSARSIDEMTNLSKNLRDLLKENFSFNILTVEKKQKSRDRTHKLGFRLSDNELIEGVLIPSKNRYTACISSQIGCTLGCKFCATSKIKFKRNLTVAEIYDQVIEIQNLTKEKKLDNIVLMGMGEPLLNYKNVMKAIHYMTSEEGLGMSPQRITLSTVGLYENIRQLADDNIKFNLAISLHSCNYDIRKDIMPVTNSNSLSDLKEAIKYFYEKTNSRITFEYLLLRGVNDSLKDAKDLASFCKIVPCKVNIIEYNPVEDTSFEKSGNTATEKFVEFIESKNIILNVRKSKGEDIDAACGQLAGKDTSSKK